MGYRSQVAVAFYATDNGVVDAQQEANFAAIKLWFDENYPKEDAEDDWGATITVGRNSVLVEYQDVKWYPDYEHVKAVNAAIEKFVEAFDANNVNGAAYEFVEVGEDLPDIKREGSDWNQYRLDVRRTIDFY